MQNQNINRTENKNMKELIMAIRNGKFDEVVAIINRKPELVHCAAPKLPKRDSGQSTLQIAIKTDNLDIAEFLIRQGANVNFIEDKSIAEVPQPVLHDCISRVFFGSIVSDKLYYDQTLNLLKLMLSKGANPKMVDCYGNQALHRAVLDARRIVTYPNFDEMEKITIERFREIFRMLIDAGADINEATNTRESAVKSAKKFDLDKYELF